MSIVMSGCTEPRAGAAPYGRFEHRQVSEGAHRLLLGAACFVNALNGKKLFCRVVLPSIILL